MKRIAIIPARANSKRIPGKNIKLFQGAPIIAYTIKTAQKTNCFDEVMVSTDSDEIAHVASSYGARIPFLRSRENAGDQAGILAVIQEVVEKYAERGEVFDYVCCMFATTPLLQASYVEAGFRLMLEKGATTVFPVVRYGYPIQRALRMVDGKTSMLWPGNYSVRSQDLEPIYHDAGQFYWLDLKQYPGPSNMFDDNAYGIEYPDLLMEDIDTPEDWEKAEFKYRYLLEKGKIPKNLRAKS